MLMTDGELTLSNGASSWWQLLPPVPLALTPSPVCCGGGAVRQVRRDRGHGVPGTKLTGLTIVA
jgi:hypothetical protein